MKSLSVALILVAFGGLPFAQEEKPEGLSGWRSAKWGMSVEQVQAALPEAVAFPADKQVVNRAGTVPRLHVPKYSLVGQVFDAELLFDDKKGLRRVALETAIQKGDASIGAVYFSSLETQLTEKYGAPTQRKKDYVTDDATWTLTRTVISLQLFKIELPEKKWGLVLAYSPRENDKL